MTIEVKKEKMTDFGDVYHAVHDTITKIEDLYIDVLTKKGFKSADIHTVIPTIIVVLDAYVSSCCTDENAKTVYEEILYYYNKKLCSGEYKEKEWVIFSFCVTNHIILTKSN